MYYFLIETFLSEDFAEKNEARDLLTIAGLEPEDWFRGKLTAWNLESYGRHWAGQFGPCKNGRSSQEKVCLNSIHFLVATPSTFIHPWIPDERPFHSSPNRENILFFLWMFNFFIYTSQIIWMGWRLVIFRIHFHTSDWPKKCVSDWLSSKLKMKKKMQFISALFHWLKLDLAILFRIQDHQINSQSK